MSLETTLARGRAAAERLMTDQCTIRRTVSETTGPGGVVTPTYSTVYTGRCRIQQTRPAASAQEAGQAHLLMLGLEVHVPVSATGIRADDEVVVTASGDSDLIGRVFTVQAEAHKTHATARRLGVTERTS